MKKTLLILVLLNGLLLVAADELEQKTTNFEKKAKEHFQKINDMKLQMSQMNMQEKVSQMQRHDSMQISQLQNMTQHHTIQQFKKEFTNHIYSKNDTTNSYETKKK